MKVHIATYQERAKKLATDLEKNEVVQGFKKDLVVRLGGEKKYDEYPMEINSAEAVKNVINKITMKEIFVNNNIKTLEFFKEPKHYPCVIKHAVGSGGSGVYVVEDANELKVFKKVLHNQYYIEPLFKSTSEYRLHCTQKEVFFAVKKIKREENKNDIIINTKNHTNVRDFLKPRLWKEIQAECIKAMKILKLDIGAFDVGYSSAGNHIFTIHEVNTNPELLSNTYKKYLETIPVILQTKYKK